MATNFTGMAIAISSGHARRTQLGQEEMTRALFCVATAFVSVAYSDTNPYATNASFAVDSTTLSLSTVVSTLEARPGAPGYSRLKIHFYSFPPTAEDLTSIANGDVGTMDKKWMKLADKQDTSYNTSNAVLVLTLDKDFKVWQVDMSVPGHSCTIAPTESDVKRFLLQYRFDGKSLKLSSKGSFVCDFSSMKLKNERYDWNVDVDGRVYAKK